MAIGPTTLTFAENVGAGAKLADLTGIAQFAQPWVTPNRGRYILVQQNGTWALLAGPAGFRPGSHAITVQDGVNTTTLTITITSADTTAPTVFTERMSRIPEKTDSSVDLRASETVTWTLLSGDDTALFSLFGHTLSLPGQAWSASKNSFVANVRATDVYGNSSDFKYTVMVDRVPVYATPGSSISPTVPTNRILNARGDGYVRSLTGGYSTFGPPAYAGGGSSTTPTVPVPTNRIRNSAGTGYVRSLNGNYSTYGAPNYG
jgi:hypothetical protein